MSRVGDARTSLLLARSYARTASAGAAAVRADGAMWTPVLDAAGKSAGWLATARNHLAGVPGRTQNTAARRLGGEIAAIEGFLSRLNVDAVRQAIKGVDAVTPATADRYGEVVRRLDEVLAL